MSDTELLHKSKPEPEPVRRLEVFTGAVRRRAWTAEQKGQVLAESYESGSDYPQSPLHLPQGGPANDNNAIVYRDADHVVRALKISWFGVDRSPTTVKGAILASSCHCSRSSRCLGSAMSRASRTVRKVAPWW